MNFSDRLNNYISELNCSSSELSNASGLSKATISRYCSGSRTPINPSEQLDKLIKGLAKIAKSNKISILNEKSIRQEFNTILKSYDIEKMINNFNQLISILKINVAYFSKTLGFDPSHLSRIRSGERKPSNPSMIFDTICNYVVSNYSDDESKKIVSSLLNCSIDKISNSSNYKERLSSWLCSDYKELEAKNDISIFLTKLNDFDLCEYIRVIKFDELKVPTIPFKIPRSKNYYSLEEMKQGELDFLKTVILSKASNSVFMCSDMQMDDMAKDLEFGKKWMFGIAIMLKKGLHLNVIHNLDRPFSEMMVGLESWIPIYMTGQISPFYLTNVQNSVYSHLNYVSNNVALTGECIKGYHNKGKYYLTNNKTEVEYYKQKAKLLLNKAKPLMKIYRDNDSDLLNNFLNADTHTNGKRKRISSSLPIYTISENLLLKILIRNSIPQKDTDKILSFVKSKKEKVKTILINNPMLEVIIKINKEEFNNFPVSLELSELFYDKKVSYTYDEYLEHFKETQKYETINKNYSLTLNKNMAFRNIQITIHLNNWVMISKNNNPTIHFIIEHPKLCKAIENFIVPVIEQ